MDENKVRADYDHVCPHLDEEGECDGCEECEILADRVTSSWHDQAIADMAKHLITKISAAMLLLSSDQYRNRHKRNTTCVKALYQVGTTIKKYVETETLLSEDQIHDLVVSTEGVIEMIKRARTVNEGDGISVALEQIFDDPQSARATRGLYALTQKIVAQKNVDNTIVYDSWHHLINGYDNYFRPNKDGLKPRQVQVTLQFYSNDNPNIVTIETRYGDGTEFVYRYRLPDSALSEGHVFVSYWIEQSNLAHEIFVDGVSRHLSK
jgi:hypothetical protein